ncbi:DUF5828 family protein [Halococcus agarilyticus]|uniref:DUF5828 family protein n=1 Tax=Halococcus agarilyticus TaxID=1232219 RepID=UPI000677FE5D|nr:DUF5828 family protein [Halococcus agarilyticus]
MEESISGFKVRGGWNDAVEHGERVTHALAELGTEGEAFEEWDEWRPKSHERLGEDVNEKTADQASIEEGEGEKAGKEPNEDLLSAGEKLSESYDRLDDPDEAVDTWSESLDYVARAADSAGRKAVRTVEDTVYRNVMTQVAPYYFDNELVSANLQRSARAREGDDDGYVFEVNVNDDDLKEQVSDRLAEYDDEVDRWHVDTPKNVEALEAAEGGEVPEETAPDSESDIDFTTN